LVGYKKVLYNFGFVGIEMCGFTEVIVKTLHRYMSDTTKLYDDGSLAVDKVYELRMGPGH